MIKHRLLRAILFAGFLGASTAPVFAQAEGLGMPGDHITGFVEISIEDADALGLVTFSRTIVAREAPVGTAPDAAAFLESMAGREIHSASWIAPDLAGLGPGAIFVSIDASENPDPRSPAAEVALEFQLGLNDLSLLDRGRSLRFRPATGGRGQEQRARDIMIEMTGVSVRDDGTSLALSGNFSADFIGGGSVSGTFNIEQVSGTREIAAILNRPE